MRHLIFDTETTGLPRNTLRQKQPRVIEFAGILWDDADDSEQEHTWLFNPGIPIEPGASRTHKLTNDMLQEAPSFAKHAPAIRALLMLADRAVAHNLFFDMHLLSCEFRRADTVDVKWPPHNVCTVEATEHFTGYRLKLEALYRHLFSEDFREAHRALPDTRALLRCYKELCKRGIV